MKVIFIQMIWGLENYLTWGVMGVTCMCGKSVVGYTGQMECYKGPQGFRVILVLLLLECGQ